MPGIIAITLLSGPSFITFWNCSYLKREGESERDAQILWEVFSAAHTHAERARGRAGRGAEEARGVAHLDAAEMPA